jgi:hypothetical protein
MSVDFAVWRAQSALRSRDHGYSRTAPRMSRPGLTHVTQGRGEDLTRKSSGAAWSAAPLRFYPLEFHAISKRWPSGSVKYPE